MKQEIDSTDLMLKSTKAGVGDVGRSPRSGGAVQIPCLVKLHDLQILFFLSTKSPYLPNNLS
jgi:hypothetical protein